jgi:hypothetical protein
MGRYRARCLVDGQDGVCMCVWGGDAVQASLRHILMALAVNRHSHAHTLLAPHPQQHQRPVCCTDALPRKAPSYPPPPPASTPAASAQPPAVPLALPCTASALGGRLPVPAAAGPVHVVLLPRHHRCDWLGAAGAAGHAVRLLRGGGAAGREGGGCARCTAV